MKSRSDLENLEVGDIVFDDIHRGIRFSVFDVQILADGRHSVTMVPIMWTGIE